MGFLKKVLGHGENEEAQQQKGLADEPVCPHTALISHWDEPADLGKPEKATYTCESCGQVFSYAQAQEFLNKPPEVLTSVSRDR